MSVNFNVLGLIFASLHDSSLREMTELRTMGSVPFGGRYRLIDFPLSNFVNSGISEVGVITKHNYGSLLDHIGSGRDWDLARKRGGIHILPPYSRTDNREGMYTSRLDALKNVWSYVDHSKAKYVILSNANFVATIDFDPILEQHISTGSDITLVYGTDYYEKEKRTHPAKNTVLEFDNENYFVSAMVDPDFSGECKIWLETMIVSKNVLSNIVSSASSSGIYSFTKSILQTSGHVYKIMGYEHKDVFMRIDSMQSFYKANMALLDADTRNALFPKGRPVFTKVGDNAPVHYGIDAKVKNSLIADGCIIEGTVENSILFRGVRVAKGAVVKNCVLMQGTIVGADSDINAMITDKNVEVQENAVHTCSVQHPLFIGKGGKA